MSTGTESTAAAGLRGVVAAQSKIGDVDGIKGELIYQGYDIHDLAEHSTVEEVVFLLWNGRLPKKDELDTLTAQFRESYAVPADVIARMKTFPQDAQPMDVLRTAVSSLDFYDEEGHSTEREPATRAAVRLTGQIGTIAAALRRGELSTEEYRAWVDAADSPRERTLRQAIHTVIAAIAHDRTLHDSSYLKGGILLALRYASTRHTTDLDFSNSAPFTESRGQAVVDALRSTLPLVAKRIGVDPAVMSVPLITALIDAAGLIVYFLVAKAVLGI